MSIILREYLNSTATESQTNKNKMNLSEGYNALNLIAKDSLMTDIEGIHVGPTNNFTWYTEKALKNSIPSWTKPYRKPFILHHNEKDGRIIGRVLNAEYTDVNTRSGTGALVFTCNVSDDEGKKGVKDGRFETVSIGVVAHDVKCSICGHSISDEGECEHERGAVYDGKTCYWMVNEMEAKELSYVIVPSDIYTHNIRIYDPTNKDFKKYEEGVMDLDTPNKIDLAEAEDLKEKEKPIDEKDEKPIVKEEIKEEPKEEIKEEAPKEEPKAEEPKTIEGLEATIEKLQSIIDDLKVQLQKEKALKKEAEGELVAANEQLKEYVIDRIITLREQLGKPVAIRENLESRTKMSLLDNIRDLEEEANYEPKNEVELKESEENIKPEENVKDTVSKINVTLNESLVDLEKDNSQKLEESEKILDGNVKETNSCSNTDYEETYNKLLNFYNL